MGKLVHDSVLDAAFNALANATGVTFHINTAEPANRAAAISDSLGSSALAGDFTNANGDTSGRKTTIAQHTSVTVTSSGTATHISIIDDTNLLYVTTCTSTPLSTPGTVDVAPWKIEILDPS